MVTRINRTLRFLSELEIPHLHDGMGPKEKLLNEKFLELKESLVWIMALEAKNPLFVRDDILLERFDAYVEVLNRAHYPGVPVDTYCKLMKSVAAVLDITHYDELQFESIKGSAS